MLKYTLINKEATKKVALALGSLNEQVVYVGGAVVSLYINDSAAEDVRPTKDIDLTFQIATPSKLEELRQDLNAKGFYQSSEEDVICRFLYEDLKIDVMSTQSVGWAPSNPWFEKGFDKSIAVNLEDIIIKVLPLPYFLATKIEAFLDRGIKDLYASHDLEDLVYLFNYTSDIDAQVLASNSDIKLYLAEKLKAFTENRSVMTAISGSLYYEQADERMEIIKERFQNIIDGI
ncbi:nucleotidyltransferase AbiEii toxin of type IV toxin-antitoxin system [Maribacter caenipelagi]|uniref:Nucleotidyltransferase AbiEii toxin of type IV toxin-antitoxin system n=1 Tax=Maribacter caenipelagi TaxID=1447781 RepID=A0A4V6PZY8_9FLAO|nr:nucleotidyl transferase AbiEii/AbiGii toxin family protein [Maribacter caenipelagi]TDS13538.1 nucleotidyltransferase AbiEii toxin of type IV toxin-antitoxin system [Maribacter caenipelagi]